MVGVMNILMTTDGYHLTMGYLIGEDAMQPETHILYARSGGPTVIPDLSAKIRQYISMLPSEDDVIEARDFWIEQGVPFSLDAFNVLVRMTKMPVSIRGVQDGQVVQPGDPIAVFTAPAVFAALVEPLMIGALMKSAQIATRFTKTAKATNWNYSRIFEVGLRAASSIQDHIESISVLSKVGLMMSSHGEAAKQAGIKAGGSMGLRYTQRFSSYYEAFMNALDRSIEFSKENGLTNKVNLSLLLDTRNTLQAGLPDAISVIKERIDDIKRYINLSVRLDSGDLKQQLKTIINTFNIQLGGMKYLPSIIVESGLKSDDVAEFEAIAKEYGFPVEKMLYGLGGYLVGGINRDFLSMVYKVSSFDGQATMKFADEADKGKESYPGNVTLVERSKDDSIERKVILVNELAIFIEAGWKDIFSDLVINGEVIEPNEPKDNLIEFIQSRWDDVAKGYIGNEKYPEEFARRPQMSDSINQLTDKIRYQQITIAASF